MRGLPDGWEIRPLGAIARMASGGTPRAGDSRYYEGGHIPWAVIGDLNDDAVSATRQLVTDAAIAESSAKLVPEGTVLLAMYGSIGKLGIAGVPMATNQAIATLAPVEDAVTSRWLFWYLLSQRADLAGRGVGATQRNISQSILRDWPVPVPSLDEQHRIVAVLEDHLSRLDAAKNYLQAAAARASTWRRSALDDEVGRSERDSVSLGDLVRHVEAGRSFGAAAAPARDDEWGVIRVSAMTWGEFRPQENKVVPKEQADPRYEIHEGDILVSRANTTAYVGAPVLVGQTRPQLLLSDKSLRLVPQPGVDPRWLVAVLSTRAVRWQVSALATGTKDSMRNISQVNLLAVTVPRTPPEEQQRVNEATTEISDHAGRLGAALTSAMARRDALRQKLLQAAFAGRL